MDDALYQRIRMALEKSWSGETSIIYSPDTFPSYGQCAQTAILIQERLGGEILHTTGWHGRGNHFYNRIAGKRVDFTADQFTMPDYSYDITYEDQPSSAAEAAKERHGLDKSKRFDAHLTRCFRMVQPNSPVFSPVIA